MHGICVAWFKYSQPEKRQSTGWPEQLSLMFGINKKAIVFGPEAKTLRNENPTIKCQNFKTQAQVLETLFPLLINTILSLPSPFFFIYNQPKQQMPVLANHNKLIQIFTILIDISKNMHQRQSGTSKMRLLCGRIEKQIDQIIERFQQKLGQFGGQNRGESGRSPGEIIRNQYERSLQELKSCLVQVISASLPQVIDLEQKMQQRLSDAEEERQQWLQKYKKIFSVHESNQLQNDKLKIEVISLSESYENMMVAFEDLKFKYHELKEKERNHTQELCLEKLNQINFAPSSKSNSESYTDRQNIKNQNQVMTCERELFLEEIKQSQINILEFKCKMEAVIQEKERIERENQELGHLLEGEKNRSDTLDREIMQLLNSNQELKLEALEQQEVSQNLKNTIQQLNQEISNLTAKIEEENIKLQKSEQDSNDLKREITQLKGENSQQRQKNVHLQQLQREMKAKISELNKQNHTLRIQTEKLLTKLAETTQLLQNKSKEEISKLEKELNEEKTKSVQIQKQSSKKSHQKMQEISKMHREISSKLQQKIHLLERDLRQKKERTSQMKYQIERLYESLQVQVEKEFKSTQKIKELSDSNVLLEKNNKKLEQKIAQIQQNRQGNENTLSEVKLQLRAKQKKFKKMAEINSKLTKVVLPKLKQELHSVKLTCEHFCKMAEMQKQQTTFFLKAKIEHFGQLLNQNLMSKQINSEQSSMSHQVELSKWKQTCKNYEEKYAKLKESYEYLSQKMKNIEGEMCKTEGEKDAKIEELEDKVDKQQLEHLGTLKTIDKLKQKCKEVEQYYRLVQQLERENAKLKEKLNSLELYSFRGDVQAFDITKPRQKFTEDPLVRYTKTTNSGTFHPKSNLNDITTKAQFQKLRLEAVKRQYDLANQAEY